MTPLSRRSCRLRASSAIRLWAGLAWYSQPSVKMATAGSPPWLERSTKSGLQPRICTCGSSVHCRAPPGNVMLSRFPFGPGVSFTVAPSAVTRSVNTFLKLCSRWDSGLRSAGSCVVSDQLIAVGRLGVRHAGGEDRAQVPLRGRAGHAAEVADRGERDEAPMAREPLLVLTGAVADPFPRPVQQIPHPLRVGELGEVAGAAGHDVVQQQRLAGRAVWPATGSLIAAMSMWSGLPPICSCRPSSSAAARLGIAN